MKVITTTTRAVFTRLLLPVLLISASLSGCRDPAEAERREYLLLKDQLMQMSRLPTSKIEPELELLGKLEIMSPRVDAARDQCHEAYSDLVDAFAKHTKVKGDIAELGDLVDDDAHTLADEDASRALELIESAEGDLEESMELIESASEKVQSCHDALQALEEAGVSRQR